MCNKFFILLFGLMGGYVSTQAQYWQQKIGYQMQVIINDEANAFTGTQKITYTNNSPDVLSKIFIHLYWNAFKPGSSMDLRSLEAGNTRLDGFGGRQDWDGRVQDRISKLTPAEIGNMEVTELTINGIKQKTTAYETILMVELSKPIAPKQTITLNTKFKAQVPIQIRRSGRDNAEGVRFSMAQWYPKVCEYDAEGWHPTPYIGREFYGVWGDFDVSITLPKKYCVAATGYIQSPVPAGFNYSTPAGGKAAVVKNDNYTWRFLAPNVHDFVWAADADYTHNVLKTANGTELHSFYKIDAEKLTKNYNNLSATQKNRFGNDVQKYIDSYKNEWDTVLNLANRALPYMEKTFGAYPYKQYSFIQGGDGGMEYPMATLLKGAGRDVVIHEWFHSWYQMMLGTNESLYGWMDEGFTTYAEDRTKAWLDGKLGVNNVMDSYQSYLALVKGKLDEPLTTHADQYATNLGYSINSYSKGSVFMEQLGYIVGQATRDKILLAYYNKWRFKHPNVNDFIKCAEQVSGLQLDWYKNYFINTSKTIDYKIDSIYETNEGTYIRLRNLGKMPMPIDVEITDKNGNKQVHYVPLNLMYGSKPPEFELPTTTYAPWYSTAPTYLIKTNLKLRDIKSLSIDPYQRMPDTDRKNNSININL
jgi:hypothetical protein